MADVKPLSYEEIVSDMLKTALESVLLRIDYVRIA